MSNIERPHITMDEGKESLLLQYETEDKPELSPLIQQLNTYTDSFYARLTNMTLNPAEVSNLKETITTRSARIIETDNKVADLFDEKRNERMRDIKDKHKEQRGDCAIGVCKCIDGRNSVAHTDGQLASTWETKAGILPHITSPLDERLELESSRLTQGIIERAQNSKKGPLLQVFEAHTSLHDPNHGCGAMKQRKEMGLIPEGVTDLVKANLMIHEQNAKLVTELYNAHVPKDRLQDRLERVAITAVFDTDTMGNIYGYGTDNPLVVTDLTHSFESMIEQEYARIYGSQLQPGTYRDTFTSIDTILEQEERLYEINEILLNNEQFRNTTREFIENEYPELTQDQRKAFDYRVARNISKQYLTGLHHEIEHPTHPFAHHGEGYQSVSLDGITMGQFDPETQVFGSSVSNSEEAIDHILTQSALMDSIGKAERPFILFLTKAVSELSTNGKLESEKGIINKTFFRILQNQEIISRVRSGELAIIPVLIEARNRKVLEIPNFAL